MTNRAVVTADGGLRDEVQASVHVTEAKLGLAMTAPAQQSFTRSIPYEITVSNDGSAVLSNVAIVNPLPSGTAFVSASNGGKVVGGQVEWSLGTLGPGVNKKLEMKLRPLATGEVVNHAEARADRGLKMHAQARTQIIGAPGLLLEVVDLEDPIEVGGDTQYNIIVRNQGGVPATNIRITATVPAELAVAKVQGPTDHKKEDHKIVFEPLTLAPGKDAIYHVFVRGLKSADVRFRVEVTSDQLPAGPLLEEESTNIYSGSETLE
jgi:uncharacterized repeat protein (TIGR01451 family)